MVNRVVENNIPFLQAQLSIESLSIQVIEPKRNFITKMWVDQLFDSTVIVEYTISKAGAAQLGVQPIPGLLQTVISVDNEEQKAGQEVDTELETFLMVRTFENVRDFVKKAGKLFEMLDGLTHLNKSYKKQVKVMRAATLKTKKRPVPQ